MANFLAPIINSQQEDVNGNPLSGGTIEVYLAGTSTPATTYSDQAGTPNTWPIVLNTLGVNNQGSVWLTGGATYKFIIKNSVGVVQRTIDNITGINDASISVDQWIVYQGTPTFVSATSFAVAGDQTQTFQIGRRIKTQNTGGLIYSTITNSVYGAPNTTITVANDSGVLDSGLSQVSYGIISSLSTSAPLFTRQERFIVSGNWTCPAGVTTAYISQAGAGGGGGGCATVGNPNIVSGAGAGGHGNFVIRQAVAVTPGTVYAVTIGASGAGGAINTAGSAGGTTTFGALVSTTGGAGGAPGNAAAYTNYTSGGTGGVGFSNGASGQDTGPVGVGANGGNGAGGPFGSGGNGGKGVVTGAVLSPGSAANGYGPGGGGCGGNYAAGNTTMGTSTGNTGGAGGPGICIVEW